MEEWTKVEKQEFPKSTACTVLIRYSDSHCGITGNNTATYDISWLNNPDKGYFTNNGWVASSYVEAWKPID